MTDREKEIVASFKPWVKAFARNDFGAMKAAAEAWEAIDERHAYQRAWTEAEENQIRAAYDVGILNPVIHGRTYQGVKKKRLSMGLARSAE